MRHCIGWDFNYRNPIGKIASVDAGVGRNKHPKETSGSGIRRALPITSSALIAPSEITMKHEEIMHILNRICGSVVQKKKIVMEKVFLFISTPSRIPQKTRPLLVACVEKEKKKIRCISTAALDIFHLLAIRFFHKILLNHLVKLIADINSALRRESIILNRSKNNKNKYKKTRDGG